MAGCIFAISGADRLRASPADRGARSSLHGVAPSLIPKGWATKRRPIAAAMLAKLLRVIAAVKRGHKRLDSVCCNTSRSGCLFSL